MFDDPQIRQPIQGDNFIWTMLDLNRMLGHHSKALSTISIEINEHGIT